MTIRESTAPAGHRGAQDLDYQRHADIRGESVEPQQVPRYKKLNPRSKRAAVLRTFLERGAAGMNCFEAVRLCHDYVLRTTVSELVRYNGIEFLKRFEQIPGHAGTLVECVRYTLSPSGEATARQLLSEAGNV